MNYEHPIALPLSEATLEQLRAALSDAREMALRCEQQGSLLHTWTLRGDAIQVELAQRKQTAATPSGDDPGQTPKSAGETA